MFAKHQPAIQSHVYSEQQQVRRITSIYSHKAKSFSLPKPHHSSPKYATLFVQPTTQQITPHQIKKPLKFAKRPPDIIISQMYVPLLDDQISFLPNIMSQNNYKRSTSKWIQTTKNRQYTEIKRKMHTLDGERDVTSHKNNKTAIKRLTHTNHSNDLISSKLEQLHDLENQRQANPIKLKKKQTRGKLFLPVNLLQLETMYAKNMKLTEKVQPAKFSSFLPFSTIAIPAEDKIYDFIKNYQPKNEAMSIDNLVRSAKFTIQFQAKNFLYFGEMQEGKKEGFGIYLSPFYIFQGFWEGGKKLNGYEISDKGYYKGKFVLDERSEVGQFHWNNGESYQGEWRNGKKNGTGVWKSALGDTYMGNWVDGAVQGYGIHLTKEGQKYEGSFKAFLKHGQGKDHFTNGDSYSGFFADGKPHGQGLYTWKQGYQYRGQFQRGIRSGKGVIYASNQLIYQGLFQKEKSHGLGKFSHQNGDLYVGNFKAGRKSGQGVLKMKEKRQILKGEWREDKFIESEVAE